MKKETTTFSYNWGLKIRWGRHSRLKAYAELFKNNLKEGKTTCYEMQNYHFQTTYKNRNHKLFSLSEKVNFVYTNFVKIIPMRKLTLICPLTFIRWNHLLEQTFAKRRKKKVGVFHEVRRQIRWIFLIHAIYIVWDAGVVSRRKLLWAQSQASNSSD